MRLLMGGLLLMTALPAYAADCSNWQAAKEEVEGGTAMVAKVCNASGGELRADCGEPGQMALSFKPGKADFPPPGGNPDFVGKVHIEAGGQTFEPDMSYAAMDGVMVLDLAADDPLAKAMGSTGSIVFSSKSAGIPATTFSLSGSSAALEALLASCKGGN